MIFETTSVNFRPSVLTMIVEHSRYSGSRKVRISRISVMPPVAVRFGRRDTVEASCRMRDPIVCTDAISQTTEARQVIVAEDAQLARKSLSDGLHVGSTRGHEPKATLGTHREIGRAHV